MIILAALIGVCCGLGLIWVMYREGMFAERSGAAILLAAIASFYPVFAAAEGDVGEIAVHILIFAGFVALSFRAYRRGLLLLAGGLIAHGLFDVMIGLIGAPGPDWWPAFCAGVDIAAGVLLLQLIQTGKVRDEI
ncbi:hypothetical protein SAMN04488515_2611 [Cognatiyoonia koreensis]|uniref:Uncharacterized protein n=1 Tax=Cognatiyoonia koreensis TaxID=364200 RepID=A0A1I0RFC4_9RHOB|nr:hypothetical protein [Cognatiyoonia koreensis]SEW39569.1 hypothetical protein SAMN04488515_2611 [Cognatiyoonia koreensis]